MSCHGNGERYETKPATDGWYESDGLESFILTSSLRVKYYRSFEYCLKWEIPMSPRRSSREPKAPKKSSQKSASPVTEVQPQRLKGKRPKRGLKKAKVDDSVANPDEGSGRDILDIINSTNAAKHVAKEAEDRFVNVTDEGVDESDEDRYSVASSVASGPSLLHNTTAKKWRPSKGECSACRKLYQKAKRMKAPIKNKLLDNDPKSLTCDQWVLIKTWRPRRLPNARGKLMAHLKLVEKRLKVKNGAQRTNQHAGEGKPSVCSRAHAFLQRNLRQCVRVPVKKERKKNRRKRTRDDSEGPRVAKQQRLHGSNHRQYISSDDTDDNSLHLARGSSSSAGFEGFSDQDMEDMEIEHLIPSKVPLEKTTKPREVPTNKKAPKRGGFRDLLAQLRGNSSMVVRETR
ncbi:uncharacterized protein [Pagrus major]|uniref:uncharacterized protein n=1 Tax=Pagrus major TaxID=143350 RepID=UPI003CC87B16